MSDDITIKLQPSAEEIAAEICRYYTEGPNVAIPDGAPEMSLDNLHALAIDHHKRGVKLLEIQDRVTKSIGIQQDLVAEISRLMEGGDQ